jgi:hypothetical protein
VTYVRVTLEALVGRTGKPPASIAKIFHDLISQAASLKRSDPEHLFLADPTLLAHAMKIGQEFTLSRLGLVEFLPTI